jgi:PAS domain S-box-containing protein
MDPAPTPRDPPEPPDGGPFRAAFECAAVGMGIVDLADARWIHVNEALCRALGYTREELRATPWPQITHPEDVEADLTPFRRMAAGELESYTVEKRFIHKQGHEVWARLTLSLVRDARGRPDFEVAIVEDITERKRVEEALRDSEERLRLAVGAADLGIWDLDLVRDVAVRSPRHDQIFGYSKLQPEWGLEIAMRHVLPEDRPAVLEAHARARESGELLHESRVRWPDGSIHWISAHGRLYFDRERRPVRIAGVVADVTERKHAEEALQQLNAQLEQRVAERTTELRARAAQLAKLVSELTIAEQRERERLARILHDHMQQLLAAANMGLAVLEGRLRGDDRQQLDRIASLIGEAIEASRSLAVELAPPILQIGGLPSGLQWLAGWFEQKHGLQVEASVDPQATALSQEVRLLLFDAVRELLFNVVKHAGVQRATVDLALADPEHLRVAVADRGRGFVPAQIAGASGIGLPTIRQRIELLGGRFEVESSPGAGARFTLLAPRRGAAASVGRG